MWHLRHSININSVISDAPDVNTVAGSSQSNKAGHLFFQSWVPGAFRGGEGGLAERNISGGNISKTMITKKIITIFCCYIWPSYELGYHWCMAGKFNNKRWRSVGQSFTRRAGDGRCTNWIYSSDNNFAAECSISPKFAISVRRDRGIVKCVIRPNML